MSPRFLAIMRAAPSAPMGLWHVALQRGEQRTDAAIVAAPDRITAEILYDRVRKTGDMMLDTRHIGHSLPGMPAGVIVASFPLERRA